MFVSSFEGHYTAFQKDVQAAIGEFQQSNVTRLIVDVTNNGGESISYSKLHLTETLDVKVGLDVWAYSCISTSLGRR